MTELKPGRYRHSKSGKFYEVIGMARHSETLERLVVYRALYSSPEFGDKSIWVRPKAMFLEKVNLNGKEVPRFEFIESI
ncbi:MAG TPA: DUF1653 domain-containing protein [Candidatus Nanoarchaeia archaeon]|nr:DUF1653 domain-containing protein [Candidatus Nanoarchaeia archaeon]